MSSSREIDSGADFSTDSVQIDGDEFRMYTNSDGSELPSVSEVLDARPTPEKDASIEGWRNWLKGQPDRPDPDEVLSYKGWRGTLAHYKALAPLARYELAGEEEFQAYEGLKGWEYRHDDALAQAEKDVEWFVEQFRQIAHDWGIAKYDSSNNVIENRARAVEQAVVDEDVGYAGRYDLLYETHDGRIIVCDLKTSNAKSVSDLFDKKFPRYGMQLAAYARASDFDVDEIQMIWISPDSRSASMITEDQFPKTREEYEDQFIDCAEQLHDGALANYY